MRKINIILISISIILSSTFTVHASNSITAEELYNSCNSGMLGFKECSYYLLNTKDFLEIHKEFYEKGNLEEYKWGICLPRGITTNMLSSVYSNYYVGVPDKFRSGSAWFVTMAAYQNKWPCKNTRYLMIDIPKR